MTDWRLAEAENEMRFRERNERIRETLTDPAELAWFICECGDAACTQGISLTTPEYEAIRCDATNFALATNHENPECETVLTENERYTTTAKIYPPARDLARKTNPRRTPNT